MKSVLFWMFRTLYSLVLLCLMSIGAMTIAGKLFPVVVSQADAPGGNSDVAAVLELYLVGKIRTVEIDASHAGAHPTVLIRTCGSGGELFRYTQQIEGLWVAGVSGGVVELTATPPPRLLPGSQIAAAH